jgi:exopolysaccharide biosynthesis operon protein EpsL
MRTKPCLIKPALIKPGLIKPRRMTCRLPGCTAVALAVLAALALLATSPAQAQQDASPLTLKAGYSVQSDSNLFRLPAGVDPVRVLGKDSAAETIGVGTLGLNFNTIQGLQTISADINAYNYRYRNFSYLDFAGINYDAAWRWAFTPRFTGNLTGQRTQTPTSFANYGNYAVRNVLTDTSTRLDGVFELYGPWRLVAGIAADRQANEQTVEGRNDYASNAADLGARLVFSSGSTLSYSLKRYNGNYLNRALDAFGQYDSGFTQVDNELRLRWLISGNSSSSMYLTRLSRSHPNFAVRDYSGFNAGADLNWSLSGKTGLTASFSHTLSAWESIYASYAQTDRISLAPTWQISGKTLLSLRFAWAQIDYLGAPFAAFASPQRRDTTRDTTLSFNWEPYRKLSLAVSLQNASRGSNFNGQDYTSNVASLSANYAY